jgi:hypothetical protein
LAPEKCHMSVTSLTETGRTIVAGGDLKNGVLGSIAGGYRTRHRDLRAVVTLLAAAAMVWAVAGPSVLSVDAAGTGNGAPSDRCHHDRKGLDQDDHHCCRCCAHPTPSPQPTSPPKRTPAPKPVRTPPARTVTVGRPRPTPAASPSTSATPQPQGGSVGVRPPVLAPPALVVPAPVPPSVIATNPVSIYVVTLAGLLIAGALAAATIVFVRRSD